MSRMLWLMGSEERLREFVREQDQRFQRAMRSELRTIAAERGLRLTKEPADPRQPRKAPKPKDVVSVRPTAAAQAPQPTSQRIMREVCHDHGLTKAELQSIRRSVHLVAARQEAMYRMSKETSLSLPAIGRLLGGRDHTTVLHGIRRHAAKLQADAE